MTPVHRRLSPHQCCYSFLSLSGAEASGMPHDTRERIGWKHGTVRFENTNYLSSPISLEWYADNCLRIDAS